MEHDVNKGEEQAPRPAKCRQLLNALIEVTRIAKDAELGPEAVAQIGKYLNREQSNDVPVVTMQSAAKDAFQTLRRRYKDKRPVTGVATGFVDLDEMTTGLQPGHLIVVAGLPATGCTTLALNIAEAAALKGKTRMLIFSTDTSAESIAMRMMSSLGRISQQHLRTGDVEAEEWPRVTSAVTLLAETPAFIVDTAELSIKTICETSYRLTLEHDIGLIVIDDLQGIQLLDDTETIARVAEIRAALCELKILAQTLDIPVLATSTLDHSLERRENKHPVLADLGEWAASVEQHADVVALIYRNKYYNRDAPEHGIAEVHVARHRNGPTGAITLTFIPELARFESFSGGLT